MRKILFCILLVFAANVYAQKISRPETLRTTEFGNQKLVVADSVFVLIVQSTVEPITIVLGHKDEALRILRFLRDADVRSGDVIELENANGDICKYNGLKQYVFFSKGRTYTGQMAKRYMKGYVEAIEKYCNEQK